MDIYQRVKHVENVSMAEMDNNLEEQFRLFERLTQLRKRQGYLRYVVARSQEIQGMYDSITKRERAKNGGE